MYPGKPIIRTSINKKKCDIIIRHLKHLRIVFPNHKNGTGFRKHGIQILCPGRYCIFMKNNFVLYKDGNISSLYHDPKRRIENKILKDIAKRNYNEVLDFKELSKMI
jgi:hypothetical protein